MTSWAPPWGLNSLIRVDFDGEAELLRMPHALSMPGRECGRLVPSGGRIARLGGEKGAPATVRMWGVVQRRCLASPPARGAQLDGIEETSRGHPRQREPDRGRLRRSSAPT